MFIKRFIDPVSSLSTKSLLSLMGFPGFKNFEVFTSISIYLNPKIDINTIIKPIDNTFFGELTILLPI